MTNMMVITLKIMVMMTTKGTAWFRVTGVIVLTVRVEWDDSNGG